MQLEPNDVQRMADPARVAIWVGIFAAALKALHIAWKWIARRILMPVLYEVAREALAEDIKAFRESAEQSRETASMLARTVFEWERVVGDLQHISESIDDLRTAQDQDHTILTVVASYLDVQMPERRLRRRRAEDRDAG